MRSSAQHLFIAILSLSLLSLLVEGNESELEPKQLDDKQAAEQEDNKGQETGKSVDAVGNTKLMLDVPLHLDTDARGDGQEENQSNNRLLTRGNRAKRQWGWGGGPWGGGGWGGGPWGGYGGGWGRPWGGGWGGGYGYGGYGGYWG